MINVCRICVLLYSLWQGSLASDTPSVSVGTPADETATRDTPPPAGLGLGHSVRPNYVSLYFVCCHTAACMQVLKNRPWCTCSTPFTSRTHATHPAGPRVCDFAFVCPSITAYCTCVITSFHCHGHGSLVPRLCIVLGIEQQNQWHCTAHLAQRCSVHVHCNLSFLQKGMPTRIILFSHICIFSLVFLNSLGHLLFLKILLA